jgi:hypothetical protein
MESTGPYAHPHATALHGTRAPSGKLRTLLIDGEVRRIQALRPRWDQGPATHIVGEIYAYFEAYLDDGRHAMLACDGITRCWWLLAVAPSGIAIPARVNTRPP